MRGAYLNYLAGVLVVVVGLLAMPTLGMAAYGDYVSTITAGGLNQPAKVAVNSATGDIYVTDSGSKTVKKYDSAGNYVSSFTLSVAGTPVGIATNGTNIFVGDDTNNCVWIYDMSGNLADLSGTASTHKLGGNALVALKMPNTVAISPGGHIFAIDGDSDKIYIFGADGSWYGSFGTSGSTSSGTNIQCYYPTGLAFSTSTEASGIVTQYFYIGDQGNNKVQKLMYKYNKTTKGITTNPTYQAKIPTTDGSSDAFGRFLRVSDVAWDTNFGRLVVLDSLQMVAQLFTSAHATMNQAFNYSAGVQGYLNVPTGMAMNPVSGKAVVVSSQSGSLVTFAIADGAVPTITALDPAVDVTPSTAPYTVNFTVNDSDSATVNMAFYYYEASTPVDKISLGTQTVTLTGGTYSGSIAWNWATDPGPAVGNYKVFATAVDTTNNYVEQTSAGNLLVVSPYDSCTNYTNAHFALYGSAAGDYDGDTISNCDEVSGTYNTAFGNQPTNPGLADSDSDGLADNAECQTHSSNPNSKDTDGGGVSDFVELGKGTNMLVALDDLGSEADLIYPYFTEGIERWEGFLAMLNVRNTETVYADIAIFNPNGSLAYTDYAVKFVNGQAIKKMFSQYGISEGSIEIRTSRGPALAAFAADYKLNKAGDDLWDCGHADSLQTTPAKRMVIPYIDDAAWGFTSYANIKNATNSTASVDVEYNVVYPLSGGAQVINKNYTVLPHQTLHLRPSAESVPGEVIITASSTSQCLIGSGVSVRSTGADPDVFDYDTEEPFQSSPSTISYCALMDSEAWRFRAWYAISNPSTNPSNAAITFDSYMTLPASGVTPSPLIKKYTKNLNVVLGNYYAQKPAVSMVATGTPNPNGGEGSFMIKSNQPVYGNMVNFRWNVNSLTEPRYYDYGFAVENSVGTATELYAPYFDENLNTRYKVWTMIGNPSDTATISVTIGYYDLNGTLIPGSSNPKVTSVPPRGNAYGRPATAGIANGARIGYTKVTCTGGEMVGYQMWSKWNKNGDQEYFDYAFAYPMLTRPYPAAPISLAVTSVSGTEVVLDWADNPTYNLAGYNVYRSTTTGTGYTKINGPTVTSSTYSDTTVTTGASYFYVVKAVDNDSNISSQSGEAKAVIP